MNINPKNGKIRRILLVEPPKTFEAEYTKNIRGVSIPPLGLTYIAAIFEKKKFEVKILDAVIENPVNSTPHKGFIRLGMSDAEIEEYIKSFNPDVVGVSCIVSIRLDDAKNICRIAKKVNPNCLTIMGGSHPTQSVDTVISDPNLDFIVLGEGDYSTLELIEYLEGKKDIDSLDGIAMKINGETKIFPKTKFISNIDELPLPARHLLPILKYSELDLPMGERVRKPWTTIVTSRGCPASCTYCSAKYLWGRKFRARSAESVLEEINFLIDEYGIKELSIQDDNFTFDKARTEKILDGIIDNGLDITWSTPSGIAIYALDESIIQKMKKSGCISLTLAVESGSQRVLSEILKKPLKLETVFRIVKDAKKYGLHTRGYFMLGMPGETKEEMDMTLELAKKLKLDWSIFSIFAPLPGTELRALCEKKGYIKPDFSPIDVQYGVGKINTEEFDANYLTKFRREANDKVNFLENHNIKDGGNVEQAIYDFKKVIRMVPGHELAHFCLGVAYEKKGMLDEARKEWRKVSEDNKLAEERLKKYEDKIYDEQINASDVVDSKSNWNPI